MKVYKSTSDDTIADPEGTPELRISGSCVSYLPENFSKMSLEK